MKNMTVTINLTKLLALRLIALKTDSVAPTVDLAFRWALVMMDNATVLMDLTRQIVP